MSDKALLEKLLVKTLEDSQNLLKCKKWLSNFNSTPQSFQLLEDTSGKIFHSDFICFFLTFLRDKASKVKSMEKLPSGNESSNVSESSESSPEFNADGDYSSNFPDLMESSKKCRRITPTPLPKVTNEDDPQLFLEDKNLLPVPKKYEDVFNKKRFIPTSIQKQQNFSYKSHNIADPYNDKTDFLINEERKKKLSVVLELYYFFIKNGLVPNIAHEIKFILFIFNYVSDPSMVMHSRNHEFNKTDSTDLLLNATDWLWFCIDFFFKFEVLFARMDFLIRNFIHSRMSSLKSMFLSSTRVNIFLENMQTPQQLPPFSNFNFKENFKFLFDSANMFEPSQYLSERTDFWKIKEKWQSVCSEDELFKDLEYLLPKKDITTLNTFAVIFIESLIDSLEESIKDNEQKRSQFLNIRITMPMETDYFDCFEFFHKIVVEFCLKNCPQYIKFIRYWLYRSVKLLSSQDFGDTVLAECRSFMVFGLKIKISLAKFLGYIEFYGDKIPESVDDKGERILQMIQAEVLPFVSLKEFILNAVHAGKLIDTIPWIVQFLSMGGKRLLSQPFYYDMFLTLISLNCSNKRNAHADANKVQADSAECKNNVKDKRDNLLKATIILPNFVLLENAAPKCYEAQTIFLKESAVFFLNIFIGRLFDSCFFGEELFFKLFHEYADIFPKSKNKGTRNPKLCLDTLSLLNDEAFLLLCSNFSKMKYWESSQSFSSRNIRPILLEPTPETNKDVQELLEDTFLKDNPAMCDIINFVLSRIFDVFQTTFQKDIVMLSDINGQDVSYNMQSLLKDCSSKVIQCIGLLLPKDYVHDSVRDATVSICLKRLRREIRQWIILQGCSEDLFDTSDNGSELKEERNNKYEIKARGEFTRDSSDEIINTRHSDILKNIRAILHQVVNQENDITYLTSALNEFIVLSRGSEFIKDCYLQNDVHNASWNFIIHLILSQPRLMTDDFLINITLFWKKLGVDINDRQILSPMVINASVTKSMSDQKLIISVIGKLICWSVKHNILTDQALEEEFVAIFRHSWNKDQLDFILHICSEMKDSLGTVPTNFNTMNYIELIADNLNEIKMTDDD